MSEEKIIAAVSKFNNKEMFAEWLWKELCLLHQKEQKEGDFYLLMIETGSSVQALESVYKQFVPEEKQPMFRQAIGEVLLEQGNNENAPIEALRDLIYLIMIIKAAESLSALLPTVGRGLLGKRHPRTLYDTMTCLKSLSPSPVVYEVMSGLIDSENFDDGYLLDATGILIECKPQQKSSIIERLKLRLIVLKERAQESGKEDQDTFFYIAKEWGLDSLSFLRE